MSDGFVERFAVPIITLSSLLVSVNGFMLGNIESVNAWQIIFGRQRCFAPIMLLLLWVRYRMQLVCLFRQVSTAKIP